MNDARALIQLSLAMNGTLRHTDLKAIDVEAAKAYAASHEDVRYEWWTEKTGPGTARVAWQLTKESTR